MHTVRRVRTAIGVASLWTVFGVLSAAQIHVRDVTAAHTAPWRDVFNVVYFYWAWALVTPLALALTPELRRPSRPLMRRLAIGIAGGAAVIGLQSGLYVLFGALDPRADVMFTAAALRLALVRHLAGNALTFAGVIAMAHVAASLRETQARELDASRVALRASALEASLARLRLEALAGHLRPHFLFNTLNMVSALITKHDAPAANRAIARLGSLMREAFSETGESDISLERELAFIHDYLDIIQLRFGPRLLVHEEIAADTLPLTIPRFILQPLVENAVVHGLAGAGGGALSLTAERTGHHLVIRIQDDGPGVGDGRDPGRPGVGLSIVREAIARRYGGDATLTVRNADGGGAVAELRLPATDRPGTADGRVVLTVAGA